MYVYVFVYDYFTTYVYFLLKLIRIYIHTYVYVGEIGSSGQFISPPGIVFVYNVHVRMCV